MIKEYPVWLMKEDLHVFLNSLSRVVHDGKGNNLYFFASDRLNPMAGQKPITVLSDGRLVDESNTQIGFISDFQDFLKESKPINSANAGQRSHSEAQESREKNAAESKKNEDTSVSRPKKRKNTWVLLLVVIGVIFLLSQNKGPQETRKVYASMDEAAMALRQAIINHEQEFTVQYRAAQEPENQFTEMNSLFQKATAHTGNPDEGDQLATSTHYDHFLQNYKAEKSSSGCIITMTYNFSYFITKAQETELRSRIKAIITELNLNGKSEYEKIRRIYNWICSHVNYDYARLNDDSYVAKYSAYNAVFQGSAVCNGFAQLLYRMALSAGLDARIVIMSSHAWNIVRVNGVYYYCDATWDSGLPESSYQYFLRGRWDYIDHFESLPALSWGSHLGSVTMDYQISNERYGK